MEDPCEDIVNLWASGLRPTTPRTLAHPEERKRRRGLLDLPHVRSLSDFARELRAEKPETFVPCFDPLDGGSEARILFLFEKPGPKTSPTEGGSGFISRDNDDPTAEATFRFMREAEIPRHMTVLWNVIPWWNGVLKVTPPELDAGMTKAEQLLDRLPRLRCVVFVGKKAAHACSTLETLGGHVCLLESYHPSPRVKAAYPEKWASIPGVWAKAMEGL